MSPPSFSIVLIARNEEKTLPKLLGSLEEFRGRGGQVVLLDTGSTDNTVAVAKKFNCKAVSVGDRFLTRIDDDTATLVNSMFVVSGEEPILKVGDTLFDYAAARNHAASLSSCDFIAMPDCDEVYTALNLDAIEKEIAKGAGRFEYNFVFSHDKYGNEEVKFLHSKFYDRRKYRWIGVVHEVLQGDAPTHRFPESLIKLEHWQNPETNRQGYLRGLALDCFQNPTNDRNSHYFARDLMYSGRYKSAIQEFQRHVAMKRWAAERSQSMVYIGDCKAKLGDAQGALDCYHAAFQIESNRREPLIRLASHYWHANDPQRCAAYANAALTIPVNGFYANDMAHYTFLPHEMLYWALWYIGDKAGAKSHWEKALSYLPQNPKFLHDARFFADVSVPKVA